MALIKPSSSLLTILIIVGLIIAASFTFVGGFGSFPQNPPTDTTAYQIKDSNIPPAKNSLQLRNPIIETPMPTQPITITRPPLQPIPTINLCPHDNNVPIVGDCFCQAFRLECRNKKCIQVISYGSYIFPEGNNCDILKYKATPWSFSKSDFDDYCSRNIISPTGGFFCSLKPVIYLYPKEKTLVDVSVETSGKIVVSDPWYPPSGWKNVLAYPDGKLIYKDKEYRELFYESSFSDIKKPENGIVVGKKDIEKTLKYLTNKLGLIQTEQKELVDFWTAKLNNLNSGYMLISIVDKQDKDKTDKINIIPKPDTMIDFLLYFKPLDKPINIKPLNLPPTPKRIGFTVVEWGGTIDYEK